MTVDETGIDKTVVDETRVDELGINRLYVLTQKLFSVCRVHNVIRCLMFANFNIVTL